MLFMNNRNINFICFFCYDVIKDGLKKLYESEVGCFLCIMKLLFFFFLGVDIWFLSWLERSGWLWKKYFVSIIVLKKKYIFDYCGKKIKYCLLSWGK